MTFFFYSVITQAQHPGYQALAYSIHTHTITFQFHIHFASHHHKLHK
jgi:hypothetical protein